MVCAALNESDGVMIQSLVLKRDPGCIPAYQPAEQF